MLLLLTIAMTVSIYGVQLLLLINDLHMTSEYRIDKLILHAVMAANSKLCIKQIIDFIMIENNRVKQRRRKGANNSQKNFNISVSVTD